MMRTSVETYPAKETSAKSMAIMLALAFFGSLLNAAGGWAAIFASDLLNSNNSGNGEFPVFTYDLAAGTFWVVLAFLLLLAGCLTLSLYPERGRRQLVAGLPGAIILIIWIIALQNMLQSGFFRNLNLNSTLIVMTIAIGFASAIALCLLASGKIKGWPDLAGLGLGLLIGIGLCMINLRSSGYYIFSPLWLSAVFFPELFSRRAGRPAVLLGVLLLVGLIALSAMIKLF